MEEDYPKFIENPKFVEWIFKPSPELHEYWEKYLIDNQGDKKAFKIAKDILCLLKKRGENLTTYEKDDIFNSIVNDLIIDNVFEQKQHWLKMYLRNVAIAVLFFTIGSVFFYLQQTNSRQQIFSQHFRLFQPSPEESKIVLSDGSEIIIYSERSHIDFTQKGKIIVDNDTILTNSRIDLDALSEVIISYGKISNVTLSDGTSVCLNAGSRLIYPTSFTLKSGKYF